MPYLEMTPLQVELSVGLTQRGYISLVVRVPSGTDQLRHDNNNVPIATL